MEGHMKSRYSYKETLESAEKVVWRVEDIIGGEKRLDFNRPFLPESLARVDSIDFLTSEQKLVLNQIRGYGYLYTFGLVEEFILPFILDHARPVLHVDDYRTRALLRFAGEEAKHIHLFKEFASEFKNGFPTPCDTIGPPQEIARAVLSHHPLGVVLVILQIEWMTQSHYLDSVHDDRALDPQFKSLLRHHWMEEAQHAKLDTLMVEALCDSCSPAEIEKGISDYAAIGQLIDGGLRQQVEFDMQSFQRATGRVLNGAEQDRFRAVQTQAIRWTYLGSGMTHPKFLETVGDLSPVARGNIEEMAPAFS
jgi:para-aminobenzoate N-oxygenase AurF